MDGDDWRALKKERQESGCAQRAIADASFQHACQIARKGGLQLNRHSEAHYSIEHPTKKWRLNIYPGNRRIWMDRNRPKAPYVNVEYDWQLLDVVKFLAETVK